MAASDSEDFESADEDIETNTSSSTSVKKTTEHSNTLNESNESSIGNTKGKPLANKNVKTKNPDDEKNNTTDKNLEENNISDKSSNKSIKESKINKQIKKDNVRKCSSSSNNEEKTQSSGVKRLGSKLGSKVTNNNVKQDKNNDSTSISSKTVNNETNSSMNNEISKQIDNTKLELKQENINKRSDNESLVSKNVDNDFSNDGWDLEDGFDDDVHSDIQSKPKDEEFEKELFPVLNKLSNLSSGASNNEKISESGNKGGQNGVGGVASNWGNWGGWGVSSLLSTATESVSTLTSHVSAGFSTVLESGLGAPDPELLAQALEKERLEKEKEKEKQKVVEEQIAEEPSSVGGVTSIGGGFSQLMSGVSQLSNKVISGGLDTLETLGKKTMEVLQDGDPGLRKKRALFFQDDDKPVLSQILREAKEVAEKSDKLEEEKQAARKVHFETLFDDYHGLVHLEALEMLSKQCQLKIHTILLGMSGDGLKDLRETLDQVKELCELSDEEDEENDKDEENSDADFAKKVSDAIQMMAVQVPHTKLIEVSEAVTNWLNSESAKNSTPSEIHQKAVSSMAEFTSVSMETFHRMAELLLIKQHHSTADEAESLTQLTGTLCARVSRMASKFTVLLSESDDTKSNNGIITTIFMESANSSSYIQDACRLIVPVLQVGAAS